MVRTHPETGKKALFLGRRINAYVIGLPVAESEELLDELWAHTTQDKFTWTQEWRVGDLVWWSIVAPCTAATPSIRRRAG